jgi:nicotinamidase/pyrazinamidase
VVHSRVQWFQMAAYPNDWPEFHPDLNIPTAQLIIRKGFHAHIDSYSAFMEADLEYLLHNA